MSYLSVTILCANLIIFHSVHASGFGEGFGDMWASFVQFAGQVGSLLKQPIEVIQENKNKFRIFHQDDPKKLQKRMYEPKLYELKNINHTEKYNFEVHTVHTDDGYHLIVHRIPPLKKILPRKVILMHHGLLGSSDDWLLLGRNWSLPYKLVAAGYDVWMVNARGNKYSRRHTHYTISNPKFWNFSWHEIGYYDLPATLNYIKHFTNTKSPIDYIGYSLGATALLVMLATIPRYNYSIRVAILLAPLFTMLTANGPMEALSKYMVTREKELIRILGEYKVLPICDFPKNITYKFCLGDEDMCSNPRLFLSNGGQETYPERLRKKVLKHSFGGGSIKTILHYMQLILGGHFQSYNESKITISLGKKKCDKAPFLYPLQKVRVPMVLFSAAGDWLATPADTVSLMRQLPENVVYHAIKHTQFTHLDFVWSEHASGLVYNPVIQYLLTK